MVTAITAIRNDDFENLRDQRAKKLLGRFDRLRYKNLRYQRVNDDQGKVPPASNCAINSIIPKVMSFFRNCAIKFTMSFAVERQP